jgi:hypothetical protein
MSFSVFKVKILIFDLVQKLFLLCGAYIRPKRNVLSREVVDFLTPKHIGIENILVGDGNDGSYVLPDDLDGITYCFSPGVGPTSQFEAFLFDTFGIKSFLIDASVKSVPSDRFDFFEFDEKFLGASSYGRVVSLNDWINSKGPEIQTRDLLLQIDIEGSEYASLLATDDEVLKRFRIIAIELHYLDLLNVEVFANVFEQFIQKISANFVVCYARANDCCGYVKVGNYKLPRVMELTLIRKDRIVELSDKPVTNFTIRNT